MSLTEIKILETVLAIIILSLIQMAISRLIARTVRNSLLRKTRGKIIKKVFQIIILTIMLVFVMTVWGVKQSELFMFMASVLTVIGIALFAQWSHLSNITAGIIIFFNHSLKLEDTVAIIDADFQVEGRIVDIGLFYVTLKSAEDEDVILPNNIFLQKMIKKKNRA